MRAMNSKSRIMTRVAAIIMLAALGATAAEKETPGSLSEKDLQGDAFPGATMGKAYEAEALYTCPMHAEVISADAELACPICRMKLNKLDEEKMTALRGEELFGCPMCPIVSKAADAAEGCPVCGMDLVAIAHDCETMHGVEHQSTMMMPEGHEGHEGHDGHQH